MYIYIYIVNTVWSPRGGIMQNLREFPNLVAVEQSIPCRVHVQEFRTCSGAVQQDKSLLVCLLYYFPKIDFIVEGKFMIIYVFGLRFISSQTNACFHPHIFKYFLCSIAQ